MKTCIVWFRRDLRLADNPALTAALARAETVVPVFVYAPEEETPWIPGTASRWWLHHSLAALDRSLHARGTALVIRKGPTLGTLRELIAQTGAEAVYWNRLYEPALTARDREIKNALRAQGCEAESFNAALLCEPWELRNAKGEPYRVFTPFWRACAARLLPQFQITAPPTRIAAAASPPTSQPIDALELLPTRPWDRGFYAVWKVGEAAALAKLEEFRDERLAAYPEHRNRPDLSASSRLSAHLHFGEIGPRQVVAIALANAARETRAGIQRGAESFVRQIGWREFAHHLLFHFPHTPEHPLDARFERLSWSGDPANLEAWKRGRTGIPIVDAGMRELWHTGWMHNRVRMIVASFLTKNLRTSWLEGARWFWDTLVDADLANNTLGWQWTAGCGADASPYMRVFNPTLQAERFDPEHRYIRHWVPELARLPDSFVHRPWRATAAVSATAGVRLGSDYPFAVVDLTTSRTAALAAYEDSQTPYLTR